jgi:hypothetical protein
MSVRSPLVVTVHVGAADKGRRLINRWNTSIPGVNVRP